MSCFYVHHRSSIVIAPVPSRLSEFGDVYQPFLIILPSDLTLCLPRL
jgi:hypothetical protein